MSLRSNTLLALILVAVAGSGQAWAENSQAPAARRVGTVRPEIVRPDRDENLQWAASVIQIDELRNQGDLTAKLFGTGGGDPAMNGLYTYLAFFESAADGWRVFRLGDFLSYRIVSDARGRVVVEVRESVMNERTSEIGARVRRLLVSWRAGVGDEPPSSVSVTAVR
jgi:hypothetical protein